MTPEPAQIIAHDPHPAQLMCRELADNYHDAGQAFLIAGRRLQQTARALRVGCPRPTEEALRAAIAALERGWALLDSGDVTE